MKPDDYLTYMEFNPWVFYIYWFVGTDLILTDSIHIRGKNERIVDFLKRNYNE